MKLAYARTSALSYEAAIDRVEKAVADIGWHLAGKQELPSGTVFFVSQPDLFSAILDHHADLVGVMPWAIFIGRGPEKTVVSSIDGSLLKGLMGHHTHEEVDTIKESMTDLVNRIADVGALKVSKVTLFSTMSCPYCKMEKEWLEQHKIEHTVSYIDLDQSKAEYVVRHTGQMGVPVTEITFEEGQPEFIIGFDKGRLSTAFNIQQSS
jgi:glutaredoxin/uncharacterized protein (DUF302 family)